MATERYCFVCDKTTNFILDKVLNHSCCKQCGARMGCHPTNAVLIHFQKKIEKIKEIGNEKYETSEIRKLKVHIERQRKNIIGLLERVKILKYEIFELKNKGDNND